MKETTATSKIILIRHARPLVERSGLFTAAAARQYILDYDAAAVEEFMLAHHAIQPETVQKVFCSPLVRARLTAKAIFGEQVQLDIRPEFREFERKVFSLPLVKLPVDFWLLSARVLWLLGLNSGGIETFKQARQRARDSADILAQEASRTGTAILVAHGLLNHFIVRELRRMGWQMTDKGGNGFVAVNVLERGG